MRLTSIVFASLLMLTAGATIVPAQTTSQTFDFTNKPSAQGLQEIATILRTVGNIKQLSVDAAASTVTVQGTADELSMTAWIVHELDQPNAQSVSSSPAQQYLVAGQSDDVIRVFHLAHISPQPPQAMQEALTILRTVADVQKVYNYTALADLVVRGPASQIAVSEYLINSLDVVKGSVTTTAEYQYQAPGQGSQVARVFYLAHATTPQSVQEILTVIRTVADIQKIFNFTPLRFEERQTISRCATFLFSLWTSRQRRRQAHRPAFANTTCRGMQGRATVSCASSIRRISTHRRGSSKRSRNCAQTCKS